MKVRRKNLFRGDRMGSTGEKDQLTGTLLVLRVPGEGGAHETYEAYVIPEGASYRSLRGGLSGYAVNPATVSRGTGVLTGEGFPVFENDIVTFGGLYEPFLTVWDERTLSFYLVNTHRRLPLISSMGEKLAILGDRFHDGDYLYEASPLLDPYLYLQDEDADRIEQLMYEYRHELLPVPRKEGSRMLAEKALFAGEGREGWLEGFLIVLKGKTKSGKITERQFLVPDDTTREDFLSGAVLPVEVYPDSVSRAAGCTDAAGDRIFEGDCLVHAAGNIPFILTWRSLLSGYVLEGTEGDMPSSVLLLEHMYIANDEDDEESGQEPYGQGDAGTAGAPPAADPATARMQVQCRRCGRIEPYGNGICPACGGKLDPVQRPFRDPVEWKKEYRDALDKAQAEIDRRFRQQYPDGVTAGREEVYDRIRQEELLKQGVYWRTTAQMNPGMVRQ